MRKGLVLAGLAALILLLSSPSRGFDIQMRISSGLWQMNLTEINAALDGWQEGVKRESDIDPNTQFINGEVGRLRLAMELEAELVFSFSRWVKLGLSAGYAFGSLDEEATLLTVEQAGSLEELARPTKVSAFPVLVSGYFNFPLGKKMSAYLRAGVGLVQARYVSREAERKVGGDKYSYQVYDNAETRGPTYLAGFGFSYSFDQSLGFFIEAEARFARVDGLTGEDRLEQKGTLYSYEEYLSQSGYWRPTMHVLPEEPQGGGVRNVHEAVVDLGGYSIKIGLLLKF